MKQYMKSMQKDELQPILEGEKLVVLFFTANWCNPCKKMYPVCERLDEKENVEIIKIDVSDLDEDHEFIQYVQVLPTFLLYKQGVKLAKVSGAAEDALISMTEKYASYQVKREIK